MKINKSNSKHSLLILCVLLFFINAKSQQNADDRKQINTIIENYISNFFLNNYLKMEVTLHERLSKRGVNQDGKLSKNYSKNDLKMLMKKKKALPEKFQKNRVTDIKIENRVATAVLDTGYPKTRWKEYIHLAKLNKKWIIIDVFWCFENIEDK